MIKNKSAAIIIIDDAPLPGCGTKKLTSLTKWSHQPPKAYWCYRIKMKSLLLEKKKTSHMPQLMRSYNFFP